MAPVGTLGTFGVWGCLRAVDREAEGLSRNLHGCLGPLYSPPYLGRDLHNGPPQEALSSFIQTFWFLLELLSTEKAANATGGAEKGGRAGL